MENTQDDTFRKLRKTPFIDMYKRLIFKVVDFNPININTFNVNVDEYHLRILRENGWTLKEFQQCCQQGMDNHE